MAKIYGQIEGASLENLTADPAAPVSGRIYFNTTTGQPMLDNGTTKRALFRNDNKFIFGSDATPANNIRLHRSGIAMLQFVPGNDTTAENALAPTLAQVGLRVTNMAAAPTVGNAGRIYFNTTVNSLQFDTGTAFLQFATLTGTETLTNKTLTTPNIDVVSYAEQTVDPAPTAGVTKFYVKGGTPYKVSADGLVQAVGAGGGNGAFNYLTNGDVESGISTFQYATTTLTNGYPSGTGPTVSTSPNSITLSAETTNPLRRTTSLKATAASAWTAGHGFTLGPVFTVQQQDLGKILNVNVNYRVITGGGTLLWGGTPTAQGLQIAIYDLNGKFVDVPPGALGFNQSSGSGQVTATFQAGTTVGQQYQVLIFNTVTSTGPVSVLFDDFSVSPNVANSADQRPITFQGSLGATVVNNGSNIPLVSAIDRAGGYNSATFVYTFQIAGDYMLIYSGLINTGTAGVTIVPLINGAELQNGRSSATVAGATQVSGSGFAYNVKPGDTVSLRGTNTATFSVNFSIIRVGGQSAGPDARVVVAKFGVSAAPTTTANGIIAFNTVLADTHGGFVSGGQYRVPISGFYEVATTNSAGTSGIASVYKNGVLDSFLTSHSSGVYSSGSAVVSANANDLLDVRFSVASGMGPDARLIIKRVTGPTTVAASETVVATYGLTTAQAVAANAVLKYDTKAKDTHNFYNPATGLWTVPVSGQYSLSTIQFSNASGNWYVNKNGAVAGYLAYTSNGLAASSSMSFALVAGDTIGVYLETAGSAGAPGARGFLNQATLERTGN